jgi:membrane protease YdiL (CAAX protease family)
VKWRWAVLAPALVGGVLLGTGRIHGAVAAYHVLCAILVLRDRRQVRPLLRWDRSIALWATGTTLLIASFLALAPEVVDPAPYRQIFLDTAFPSESSRRLFPAFAAYSLAIHSPLEEVFWRAVVTDPARASRRAAVIGNAVFFGLVHAVPLGILLGLRGVLFSLPTAAAGAIWAGVTLRTRSLWPALISHLAADAMLLAGMWFFFIR